MLRREVAYAGPEKPGTIVVDPAGALPLLLLPEGRAVRYGVGVGKAGFEWSGSATVNSKQEWPDWYPVAEMLERRPEIVPMLVPLQSGMGVPGGPRNPIGARGLYLWQGNVDTLYRIHGTTEPYTIGQSVSSGCIRMINQDVIDLYDRVAVGTEVMVLAPASPEHRVYLHLSAAPSSVSLAATQSPTAPSERCSFFQKGARVFR